MKTRTKSTKTSVEESEPKTITPKAQLSPESSNPPQLFILPKDISPEARIVTLQSPRYSTDSRYVVCPQRGFFEFTKVAAPNTTPRSFLLSSTDGEPTNGNAKDSKDSESGVKEDDISKGYITKSANLFIATPVDPLFLVVPALSPPQTSKVSEPAKKLFLSGEDYFDRIGEVSSEFKYLVKTESVRKLLEARMGMICDTVDAGDETMYRINEEKLLKELIGKAKEMIKSGLPASMEDKLIRKHLEVPMLCMKRDESFAHELVIEEEEAALAESGISTPATESTESQLSISTTTTSFSEASTAATSFSETTLIEKVEIPKPTINAPEGIADLLRLRTAFLFICSNYLPPHLTITLKKLLSSETSPVDFTPLETHLTHLQKLRQDALAARSLGDVSRKRSLEDDEDESRAEKKRKLEEEEKRKKAGESQAVRNLKKVNTQGMKKMSDFFKKKA